MWGDDPSDFKNRTIRDGRVVCSLPESVLFDDWWVVDLEWIFMDVSDHPITCLVTGLQFIGERISELPKEVIDQKDQRAEEIAAELFRRYEAHFNLSEKD